MNYIILPSIFSGSVWQIVSGTSAFGLFILGALIFMSLGSWVIIFSKWRQFRAIEKADHNFLQSFRRTRNPAESIGAAKSNSVSPLARLFLAGYNEMTGLKELGNVGEVLQGKVVPLDAEDYEIIEMTMDKTRVEEIGKLEKMVIFLATTGNSAPFMGLLGTVVGIMDSFWSIGERGSASLAVVAPGIAEALLATIVGLGAAIPAVIGFNWANNKIKFANDASGNFIMEFLAHVKREARR